MTSKQLTGTMDVEIPEDCPEEELEQIQKVLEESIADSLKLNPEDVEVTVDPETGEAKYVIGSDDPIVAEETQKVLKNDDFVQNVNKAIGEHSENLPAKICEDLEIEDVNPDEEIVKKPPDVIIFFHSFTILIFKFGDNFCFFFFEVDEQKMTSKQLTGTMDVEIPEDFPEEGLEQIQKVLEESIADSLKLNPEDVEVTVDPETGEAKYVIGSDDPIVAEETQKVLKNDDFVQNVNKAIGEHSKNLPAKIREALEIEDVNANEEIVKKAPDVIIFFHSFTILIFKFGDNFCFFFFEVDEQKMTSKQLTGTMDVEIPEDCPEEELEQIQKVLEESIADSLKLNPEDVEVTVDPETGEAKYVIGSDDPIVAEETQKVLKNDDFVQNVNKAIGEHSENLPAKIREDLEIEDVNPDEEIVKKAPDVIIFFHSFTILIFKFEDNFCFFFFEVDEQKMTSKQLTGTMDVEIPEDCPEEELEQIQKVLEESIADSLKLNPEDVEVTVDPETGEAKYVIGSDDPIVAEETQKVLKNDDFVQNVNKAIGEHSENLPAKICEDLEIEDVNPDEEIVKKPPDVIIFFHSFTILIFKFGDNFCFFFFEVDEQKMTSKQLTGTMDVEIPEDCPEEELEQIQKVLEESIADSLKLNPEDVEVTVDPETGEAKYVIGSDDPIVAEETQKVLKNDDFVQNVNKAIGEHSKNLPAKIREALEIEDVNADEEIVKKAPDVIIFFHSFTILIFKFGDNFCFFFFEVDEQKMTSKQLTGTMDVEIPEDCPEEELEQIQKVLEESIADSLKLNPKDVEVTVDPETGEAKYVIGSDDPIVAEETQKVLKNDDFVQNVNKAIGEHSKNLPAKIREDLEIEDVNPDEEIVKKPPDVIIFFHSFTILIFKFEDNFCFFFFEVDEQKMTSKQLTGTMDVEIPEDCPEEELEQIQKVLEESIADSLKLNPEDVEVTVDPETGEAKYVIGSDDPIVAEETQKVLKNDDFVQNVNKAIGEHSKNLPAKIREDLELKMSILTKKLSKKHLM